MEQKAGNQFGTFGGVFTPSILTILGVVMFMITGFVVGEAGIWSALLILFIAKAITFFTGLSISAVSTNTRVEGGGAYFLISRSLGAEFGGSIGLALFLAQALSVPFYVLGFVKALTTSFYGFDEYFLLLGICTAVGIFIVNYVGASWAIRAQYAILAVLVVAIVFFLGGAITQFEMATFQANTQPAYIKPGSNFWTIFAIFFPAVTGIMAGVNMSGDLKEPAKSIPKGTLLAIGVGALIYGLQIVITGGSTDRLNLIQKPYESLLDQALFGGKWFVVAGVCAATLSSAIGSLMGAPRILQALARDDIFPVIGYFAHGTEDGDEPRRGLWLTLAMTIAVLMFAGGDSEGGALEAVAVVLTMFFLFTYGMTNMAAFIEQFSKNPSFRPRFRFFHWSTALLGAIGCFGAAILINAGAAIASLFLVAGIFLYISRRVLKTSFGDARRGFYYQRVRENMHRLAGHPPHPKNWRPTSLVLSGNPESRLSLASFAKWFESGRGLVTIASVVPGDVNEQIDRKREYEEELTSFIDEHDLSAFPEVVIAPSFDDGVSVLLQAHSIGPLKPNLVMVGWPTKTAAPMFAKHTRLVSDLGMSQVILVDRGIPTTKEDNPERIDVWWRGQGNGSLMVILAYLVTKNWPWKRAKIRILTVLEDGREEADALKELESLVEAARLEAETKVLRTSDGFRNLLIEESGDADLVFLGFRPASAEKADEFFSLYEDLTEALPTALIVHSSGDADLLS